MALASRKISYREQRIDVSKLDLILLVAAPTTSRRT